MTLPALPSRDLRGHGAEPPRVALRDGAKAIVSLVVNLEEGAEWAVSDGDAVAQGIAGVRSVVEPGRGDQGTEQQFACGVRAGVWRILRELDAHRRVATFWMCGRTVERSP
jgi:hypothetical protein